MRTDIFSVNIVNYLPGAEIGKGKKIRREENQEEKKTGEQIQPFRKHKKRGKMEIREKRGKEGKKIPFTLLHYGFYRLIKICLSRYLVKIKY